MPWRSPTEFDYIITGETCKVLLKGWGESSRIFLRSFRGLNYLALSALCGVASLVPNLLHSLLMSMNEMVLNLARSM